MVEEEKALHIAEIAEESGQTTPSYEDILSVISISEYTLIPDKKCLVIDDSAFTRLQVKKILYENKLFLIEDILEAEDGLEGFKKYKENLGKLDLVLCDVQMKNLDGLKFIKMVKDFEIKLEKEGNLYLSFLSKIIPIIIMTGTATKNEKFKGLEMGAKDFIFKPSREITQEEFEREVVIRSKIHVILKRTQEKLFETSMKLKEASIIDPLTGIFNRRYMKEIFEREISRFERKGGVISAMIIDMDDFKKINDTYGHPAGDKVLIEFAARLKKVKRKYDYIVRYGGDEFLLILPETRPEGVSSIFERIKISFEREPIEVGKSQIILKLSGGASFLPSPKNKSYDDLLKNADYALYEAKKSGKSCLKFFY
jgi:two-component system cell cycle response regulator